MEPSEYILEKQREAREELESDLRKIVEEMEQVDDRQSWHLGVSYWAKRFRKLLEGE